MQRIFTCMSLPSVVYQGNVRRKILKHDVQQLKCITQFLDPLHEKLTSIGSDAKSNPLLMNDVRGLYIWGGVGCGKTYIMDLFRENLPRGIESCRMHFHSFMKDVHRQLHKSRMLGNQGKPSDVADAVQNVIQGANLLCFDEMMVTDVADAMILKRIFKHLYERGLCLVTTSNREPQALYQNGLNREQFLPFIDLLLERCHVHSMKADIDYRSSGDANTSQPSDVYFFPTSDARQRSRFEEKFRAMSKGKKAARVSIRTDFNRDLFIPKAVLPSKVCRFTFNELFCEERSATDYEAISQRFHTIFIEDFPKISIKQSNEVRRMINALDVFYQNNAKLIILADAEPKNLCLDGDNSTDLFTANNSMMQAMYSEEFQIFNTMDEQFMIQRALSRLTEMKSAKYQLAKWKGKG